MSSVDRQQRYSRNRRCPICDGCEQDPRGKGKRCIGYRSADGQWARCSRPELAGSLDLEASSETYVHKLAGACKCGAQHGAGREPDDIEATYDYRDEGGHLLFQVVRKTGKKFVQRRPSGPDWIWKLDGCRRVLYRLPELLAADVSKTVYIVEGEKDVETLERRGYLATTNPGGASKWHVVSEHARQVLAGRSVVVIADDDPVDPKTGKSKGREHAKQVAADLQRVARSVRLVRCPSTKDITDHFAASGTIEQLEDLPSSSEAHTHTNGLNGANGSNGAAHPHPLDDADVERLERLALESDGAIRVTADWPEADPFDALDLPAFPTDALSPWMRAWAEAEAVATQTPVDLSACLALASASLAVARTFHVQVRDGWVEPTNLWIVVAMPPGERKSAVYADATAPIYAYVAHESDRMAPQIATNAFERRVLEGQIKEAEGAAIKGKMVGGVDARAAARRLRDDLERSPELKAPVLLTDDCTSEALAKLLSEQGERMGIFSAEGGPFELMSGRYTEKGTNFEMFLKAHPGDPHLVHRITRDPISLRHPLLTMALTVQPAVIRGLATKEGFRGRGLLARFFYALPQTALGKRLADPEPIDPGVRGAYQASLATLLVRAIEQQQLRLSDEADRLRSEFQTRLEPRLGIDGDLHVIGDWSNKLLGGICRVAGVLHVGDHALDLDRLPQAIPAPTLERAIAIGHYFLQHALAAFDVMGLDDVTELAKRIYTWARRLDLRSFSTREARRASHCSAAEASAALAILIERGIVRPRQRSSTGGRPSEVYEVRGAFGTFGTRDGGVSKYGERESISFSDSLKGGGPLVPKVPKATPASHH